MKLRVAMAAVVVVMAVLTGTRLLTSLGQAEPRRLPSQLIGQELAPVPLQSPTGTRVNLIEYLDSRPAFLFLVTGRDCLGCGAFADELKLLQRQFPQHATLLIGVGADSVGLTGYARRHRVDALFDPDSSLPNTFGIDDTPLFLAVGAEGVILLVDARTGPGARSRPISQIVAALSQNLNTATAAAAAQSNNPTAGGTP